MVVFHHATLDLANQAPASTLFWQNGAAGVDIFFVISGFVMAVSTIGKEHKTHPARAFLERRLIRIVPLYWLMTLLMFARLTILHRSRGIGHAPMSVQTPLPFLLASLLFLPFKNSMGTTKPILEVGWTLSFEMLFYLLFAAALALRTRVTTLLAPIMIGLAFVSIFRQPTWPAILDLADPLLLEFLAGLLLGEAIVKGLKINVPVSGVIGLVAMLLLLFLPAYDPLALRFIWWGIPAFLAVNATVALENRYGNRWPRWMLLIGDASYSLYLSHVFVITPLLNFSRKTHLRTFDITGIRSELVPALFCLIASICVAIPIYLFVERPTTNWLRATLLREGEPKSNAVS